ncbi:hypothetical protein AB6A40_003231 [Gnathostoma spinigerum]|uniref:Uncharacterized protein n=1 Tax=Gnathostoma spinigerum TaxID=75299 RepID=A0ABD6EIX0_9BILA
MMRFQRTTFDDNDDIRTHVQISWISQNQICFQPLFFGDSWKPITDQGLFFTMLLAHDTNNSVSEEFDCMSVDFHGRPSSMNRFMEGKGRSRDGYNDDLCPSIRHEVFIEVRARYAMLENDDEGTACRIIGDDDDDEFDCRSRCRMHVIRDACHCTAYSLSYLVRNDKEFSQYPLCDYTKCDPHVLRNKYDDRKCSNNCKRHCEQIRYQVDHDQKGPMVQKDLTLINLNWRSFEYINLEQQKVWTFATFIAALGGSIGVWLGLSVLSLLQGITFLYHVIRKKIKKRIASGNIKNSQVMSTNEIPVGWKTSSDGPTPKLSVNPIPSEMAANPFANPYVDHNKEKKRKIRIADEDRSGN